MTVTSGHDEEKIQRKCRKHANNRHRKKQKLLINQHL